MPVLQISLQNSGVKLWQHKTENFQKKDYKKSVKILQNKSMMTRIVHTHIIPIFY